MSDGKVIPFGEARRERKRCSYSITIDYDPDEPLDFEARIPGTGNHPQAAGFVAEQLEGLVRALWSGGAIHHDGRPSGKVVASIQVHVSDDDQEGHVRTFIHNDVDSDERLEWVERHIEVGRKLIKGEDVDDPAT